MRSVNLVVLSLVFGALLFGGCASTGTPGFATGLFDPEGGEFAAAEGAGWGETADYGEPKQKLMPQIDEGRPSSVPDEPEQQIETDSKEAPAEEILDELSELVSLTRCTVPLARSSCPPRAALP